MNADHLRIPATPDEVAQRDLKPAKKSAAELAQLTERWAKLKCAEVSYKEQADQLRAEILEGGAEIGYQDSCLHIRSVDDVDYTDKRLARALRDEGATGEVMETRISPEKVRALAKLNERIAGVLAAIAKKTPRFERVK